MIRLSEETESPTLTQKVLSVSCLLYTSGVLSETRDTALLAARFLLASGLQGNSQQRNGETSDTYQLGTSNCSPTMGRAPQTAQEMSPEAAGWHCRVMGWEGAQLLIQRAANKIHYLEYAPQKVFDVR